MEVDIKLNIKIKDEPTDPEWQNIKGCVLQWVDYLKCEWVNTIKPEGAGSRSLKCH